MHLLIDGMNVIGSRPDDRWWRDREGAMPNLVRQLRSYASASGDSATVFFDAKPFELPDDSGGSGVEVVFAFPGPDAADDEIVEAVRTRPRVEGIRVVTSDADLTDRVRGLGVPVISSGSFRRRLDELASAG